MFADHDGRHQGGVGRLHVQPRGRSSRTRSERARGRGGRGRPGARPGGRSRARAPRRPPGDPRQGARRPEAAAEPVLLRPVGGRQHRAQRLDRRRVERATSTPAPAATRCAPAARARSTRSATARPVDPPASPPASTAERRPHELRNVERQGSGPPRPARWSRLRAPQRLGCRLRPHPRAGRLPGHSHDQRGHRLALGVPDGGVAAPRNDARARRSHRRRSERAGDRRPRGRVRRHRGRGRPTPWPGPWLSGRWAPTSRMPRSDGLFGIDEAVDRITAARAAAPSGTFVLNARTDTYFAGAGGDVFAETVERALRYVEAGADCVFVPGVVDEETIRRLADAIPGPLNVVAGLANTIDAPTLFSLGRQAGQPGRQLGPSRAERAGARRPGAARLRNARLPRRCDRLRRPAATFRFVTRLSQVSPELKDDAAPATVAVLEPGGERTGAVAVPHVHADLGGVGTGLADVHAADLGTHGP